MKKTKGKFIETLILGIGILGFWIWIGYITGFWRGLRRLILLLNDLI